MYQDPINTTYYGVTTNSTSTTLTMDNQTVVIISMMALVAALLVFFLFVKTKDKPASPFLAKLREFLNFRSIIIDGLIKFFYLCSTFSLTITAFWMMFQKIDYAPLLGIFVLIFGNLLVRVIYEFIMMLVGIWTNTSDIRKIMLDKAGKKAETKKD